MIEITTLLLGFYMAWNIGANDVANAMGTSVGSKALTLKKAVLLAALLEFAGAFLSGSAVSETIQKGIVEPTVFESDPHLFVLGMMGSLLATGALLQLASYFALPVSTTHAIVGAVLGFGVCIGGVEAIHWDQVMQIALSWIFSPVLSGLISYLVFTLIQRKIFLAKKPLAACQKLSPYFVFAYFFIVSSNLFYGKLLLSFSLATGAALLSRQMLQPALSFAHPSGSNPSQGIEKTFMPLQILSASLIAFAHGSNDVANAIGPVSAILNVLDTNSLSLNSPIPHWLLLLGGSGIVIGLATWGWRVIETIGNKITELTPSRGFSAEFGAAITILCASKLGLPISTTHALIGGVFGVGIGRGLNALNIQTIKEIAVSWIVTIPLCALFSIAAFYLFKSF